MLKRIELWILLAVAVAGVVFVFSSRHHTEYVAVGKIVSDAGDDAPLKLHRCVVERDYGNAKLDIEVRVKNDGADKLVLQPPKAKLLTAAGREIPSFFLPFDPQPEVAANSTQDVRLRYWLEAKDLNEALKLEVNGKFVEVKGATPFDLNSIKSGEKKAISAGAW